MTFFDLYNSKRGISFFVVVSLSLLSISIEAQTVALPVMRITYSQTLNYDNYIPGTMQLTDTDGTVVELMTKFKTRGATSRNYSDKPSMNMKIRDAENNDLDTTLLGLRQASSFILDAMAIDRINMRNRVCFDIWNAFSRLPYETDFGGRNGTVGKFVELYINDQYKGIYCLSDKINRKLLGLKKPKTDSNGNLESIRGVLYKHGTNDIDDQETEGLFNGGLVCVIRWHDAWELQEPDDYPCAEVWAPLYDFYEEGHYNNYDYIKQHFYLQNIADYTIHLMALCIEDNWGNKNKFFSIVNIQGSGDETRFVITPWDLDTSLGGRYDGAYYDGNYSSWTLTDIARNAPRPFSTALTQQDFQTMLRDTWIRGRQGAFAIDSVKQRLYDYCDLFENSGAWQRTISAQNGELIVQDLRKEINLVCEWYENRFQQMDDYFNITDEDLVTELEYISANDNSRSIYNLQGVRINNITLPGLYIIDGKKVLVK